MIKSDKETCRDPKVSERRHLEDGGVMVFQNHSQEVETRGSFMVQEYKCQFSACWYLNMFKVYSE